MRIGCFSVQNNVCLTLFDMLSMLELKKEAQRNQN